MAGYNHAPVCQPEAAMFVSCPIVCKYLIEIIRKFILKYVNVYLKRNEFPAILSITFLLTDQYY